MRIIDLANTIERHLSEYCGTAVQTESSSFISTLPQSFLREHCPDVVDLPAAFVSLLVEEEHHLSIHLSEPISGLISSAHDARSLLSHRDGLNAVLVMIEEISHFHHYINCAKQGKPISRFDLELVAELEKIAVCSLIANDLFGRNYTLELVKIVYGEFYIHSQMTDYNLISKLTERFWKLHLQHYGPSILKNQSFRQTLRKLTQNIMSCREQLSIDLIAA
jgi:hypothetical protein